MASHLDIIRAALGYKTVETKDIDGIDSKGVESKSYEAEEVKDMSDRAVYTRAIAQDSKHRYPGVTGDLFKLEELKRNAKSWDGTMPLLVPVKENNSDHPEFSVDDSEGKWSYEELPNIPATVNVFQKRAFKGSQPLAALQGFPLKNIAIAGGALTRVLMGRPSSDVDMFVYGLTREQLEAKITELGKFFLESGKYHNIELVNTDLCATFRLYRPGMGTRNAIIIQVVLRLYNTISEIVHGFDIGASQVIYDDSGLWFTSGGRLAYEHKVIMLDLDRRRPSYEQRLVRYMNHGFALALPMLDSQKALDSDTNKLDLPLIEFVIKGQHATHKQILLVRAYSGVAIRHTRTRTVATMVDQPKTGESKEFSDTDAETDELSDYGGQDATADCDKIAYCNFVTARRLVAGLPTQIHTLKSLTRYAPDSKALNHKVYLNTNHLIDSVWNACVRHDGKTLEALLGAEGLSAIAVPLMLGRLDMITINKMVAALVEYYQQSDLVKINPCITKIANDTPTMLQGLFKRDTIPAREWYGKYYKDVLA